LENIKESHPSNVSTVVKSIALLTNVPIPSRRIMMTNKPTTRKTNTRRNFIIKRKTSTPKKTSSLQTRVNMNIQSFYL
jgi:hypothetical protein